jgi:ATPase subunit of ABC transporter with duplicated ATPase domains
MRLQLARALMCPSDLLLLDEPTNHLDLDALVWLEAWLKRYDGTLIVISHDREFLDAITKVTLHIDNGKLTRYGGNYSTFEDMRAEQIALQQNGLRQAAGQDRPPAEVHRPLQGQGQQGQAGAEPGQGARAHGKDGAGAGQRRVQLRIQGTGQPAQPHAVDAQRQLRLSAAGSAGRHGADRDRAQRQSLGAWPVSASASSAPTARASPRW